jgi:hypothetical protein
MNELKAKKPNCGNWVSKRSLYVSGMIGVLLLGLSFIFLTLIVGAVFFILVFTYFLYARYKFSPQGGNVQAQIQELVLGRLDWDTPFIPRALKLPFIVGPLSIIA